MDVAMLTRNSFFCFSPHALKVWCDQTNRITLPVAVCAWKWQQHRVCSLKEFLEHQIPVVRVGLELETGSWTKAQSVRWAASLNDTHNIHQKHLFVFMLMIGCFSLFVTGSPLYLQNMVEDGSKRTNLLLSFTFFAHYNGTLSEFLSNLVFIF